MAPVEIISVTPPNASSELNPIPGAGTDPAFLVRYSKTLDDYGFNYTLIPYSSSGFDPFTTGATVAAATKDISVIIAGGSDAEQTKDGNFLTKEQRYGRLEGYIRILRRAWDSAEPFDWEDTYYTFKGSVMM